MNIEELKQANGYYQMSESEKQGFHTWLARRNERMQRDRECAQWAEENPNYHSQTYFFGD